MNDLLFITSAYSKVYFRRHKGLKLKLMPFVVFNNNIKEEME
jgi:hypothetical protein